MVVGPCGALVEGSSYSLHTHSEMSLQEKCSCQNCRNKIRDKDMTRLYPLHVSKIWLSTPRYYPSWWARTTVLSNFVLYLVGIGISFRINNVFVTLHLPVFFRTLKRFLTILCVWIFYMSSFTSGSATEMFKFKEPSGLYPGKQSTTSEFCQKFSTKVHQCDFCYNHISRAPVMQSHVTEFNFHLTIFSWHKWVHALYLLISYSLTVTFNPD